MPKKDSISKEGNKKSTPSKSVFIYGEKVPKTNPTTKKTIPSRKNLNK